MRSPSDPGLQKQTSTVSMVNNKFPPTTVWRNCLGRVLKRANQTWSGCLIITQQFNLKSFTPFPPKHSAGHHFSASAIAIFVLLARVSRRMDKEGARGKSERHHPIRDSLWHDPPSDWAIFTISVCLLRLLLTLWENTDLTNNFRVTSLYSFMQLPNRHISDRAGSSAVIRLLSIPLISLNHSLVMAVMVSTITVDNTVPTIDWLVVLMGPWKLTAEERAWKTLLFCSIN